MHLIKVLPKWIAACLLVVSASIAHAQSDTSNVLRQKLNLNIGIGFKSFLNSSGSKTVIPPLSLSIDYSITPKIDIGGCIAVAKSKIVYSDWSGSHTAGTISHFVIGGRGLYHLAKWRSLEPYLGALLVYDVITAKASASLGGGTFSTPSKARMGLFAGARRSLKGGVQLFGEFGYGMSLLNVGMTIPLTKTQS